MQEYCSNLTVNGKTFSFYDLEKAAKSHDVKVGELPYTIRILLESLLRKKDGVDVKESHISDLMKFPNFPTVSEVPFKPSRVILQDFTGVPVVVDLASMRDAIVANGGKADLLTLRFQWIWLLTTLSKWIHTDVILLLKITLI